MTSSSSAADIASSVYLSAIEKELIPNLLINCCKAFKVDNEMPEPLIENGSHSTVEPKQVFEFLSGNGFLIAAVF